MTSYLVLRVLQGGNEAQEYRYVANADARSAQAAIRAVVESLSEDEGEFVAVPARSWRPVTVKVETKTALRFS